MLGQSVITFTLSSQLVMCIHLLPDLYSQADPDLFQSQNLHIFRQPCYL